MAGFSVQDFATALPQGGARSGLFQCVISIPNLGGGIAGSTEADKRFKLTAHASSVPASTIEPVDVSYFGRTFSIPGSRTFEDWTTTIYNTEDFKVRDAIEKWSEAINGHETNTTAIAAIGLDAASGISGAGGAYTADVKVELMDKKGTALRTYTMFDAWPAGIGAIDLAWEGNDIQTFEVTWSYNYWLAS